MTTPQEFFWMNEITESYARDNSAFTDKLGLLAWERALSKIDKSKISLRCTLYEKLSLNFL